MANKDTSLRRSGRPQTVKTATNVTPTKGDVIEVEWRMDSISNFPLKWFRADVILVEESTSTMVVSKGVIRYTETRDFTAETHDVDFLKDFFLRQADNTVEHEENEKPSLSWRFRNTPSFSRSDRGEHNENVDVVDNCVLNDPEWTNNTSKKRPLIDLKMVGSTLSTTRDVKRIREAYASLVVSVERMTTHLERCEARIVALEASSKGNTRCLDEATNITSQLQRALAARCEKPLRYSIAETKLGKEEAVEYNLVKEGYLFGSLKVRLPCSLNEFSMVARVIRVTLPSNDEAVFYPSFDETQCPSELAGSFCTKFRTFAGLCEVLRIHSAADRLAMLRKCGSSKNGDILRIFGTMSYGVTKLDPSYMFIGGSSNPHYIPDMETRTEATTNIDCSASRIHSLFRATREIMKDDGCFVSELEPRNVIQKWCGDPNDCSSGGALNFFLLKWIRSQPLGRCWSSSLRADDNRGILELTIPYVQFHGAVLCTEVGGTAHDGYLINNVVSNSS